MATVVSGMAAVAVETAVAAAVAETVAAVVEKAAESAGTAAERAKAAAETRCPAYSQTRTTAVPAAVEPDPSFARKGSQDRRSGIGHR